MKNLLTLLSIIIVSSSAFARDFAYTYQGQTLYYTVLDEGAKTCETKKDESYKSKLSNELIIPEQVSDGISTYKVTGIGNYSFYDCSTLTEITIPKSVTRINYMAFCYCKKLGYINFLSTIPPTLEFPAFDDDHYSKTIVNIPKNAEKNYLISSWGVFNNIQTEEGKIETVSDGVFNYYLIPNSNNLAILSSCCSSHVGAVTIPERFAVNNNTGTPTRYYLDAIGYGAFMEVGLSSVTFNSKCAITAIGAEAFSGTAISSIELPKTVRVIETAAFHQSKLKSVTLNEGLEEIRRGAFSESNITEIELPSTVKSIGELAFSYTKKFSKITLNEGLETIGKRAFEGSEITEIEIPSSVISIGDEAFYNTLNLRKVILNEGLVSIGKEAFARYLSSDYIYFDEIYMPSTLKFIGEDAFKDFLPLRTYIPSIESWLNIDFASIQSNPFSYSKGCPYINNEPLTELTIPSNVTVIKPFAFAGCKSLSIIHLNNGLKSIGEMAFYGQYLKESTLSIPGSVEYIGSQAFGLQNITTVKFEYGPNEIEIRDSFKEPKSLFLDRLLNNQGTSFSKLENVTLGNSVEKIPYYFCKDATKLNSVTLGGGLTSVGGEAFYGCSSLTEIVLPPNIERIDYSAFANCKKLSKIVMGSRIKEIDSRAFEGCAASTVYITAPVPPKASNNSFSNYSGKLYLQNEEAVKLYYDAYTCWDRFSSCVMVGPSDIQLDCDNVISGKPGDKIQLAAKLLPENVSLPYIFWRSTNPEIASVDNNGLVTLHEDVNDIRVLRESDNETPSCKIIAESLYANFPKAEVIINSSAGSIKDIISGGATSNSIDYKAPFEVYNVQGILVGHSIDNLNKGIYIVRQGLKTAKIAVNH